VLARVACLCLGFRIAHFLRLLCSCVPVQPRPLRPKYTESLSDRELRLIADRDDRALKRNQADEKTDLLEGLALELWLRLCELPGPASQCGPRWIACVEFFTGYTFLWTHAVEVRLARLDEQYALEHSYYIYLVFFVCPCRRARYYVTHLCGRTVY
jgi:hypothetical protein